ncbi:MAG: hypothetical protein H7A23_04260 [Leptospiraceae bacterium]|nr:hypothetical protein [Leptospiraceae bacterium]
MEIPILLAYAGKDYNLSLSGVSIMATSLTMVVLLSLFCIYKLLSGKQKE